MYDMAEVNRNFICKYRPLNFNAYLIRGKTHVAVSREEDYLSLIRHLTYLNIDFSVTEVRKKTSLMVLRGIPAETSCHTIAEELQFYQIYLSVVEGMHSPEGIPYPLHQVRVLKGEETEKLKVLKSLFGYGIKVEPFRTRRPPPQCTRCQEF